MMAACCGIENNLGRLVTPLRACYNKAQEQFFKDIPDFFFEVVMAYDDKGELGVNHGMLHCSAGYCGGGYYGKDGAA